MRILYLDICAEYVNPTRSLAARLLAHTADVVFFGPGYVSSDVLRRGIKEFIREKGEFDLVVTNEHFAFSSSRMGNNISQGYKKNYVIRSPLQDIILANDLLKQAIDLEIPKVVTLFESDYYNFSEEKIASVDQNFDLVVGWGEQFFRRTAELPNLKFERFAARSNDNWYDFVKRNKNRIIPLVHFVSDEEFCYTPLSHRPADWSVPGTRYHLREAAARSLSRSEMTLSRGKPLPIIPLLTRMGLRPLSRPLLLKYYQERFREEIRRSRFSFTCGSGLGWPIRKFFEIPALGSLLVCSPCNGFEALGFHDGVNSIACEPGDLPALGRRLLANLDEAQSIADAGRELVGSKHTVVARALQLRQAFTAFLDHQWFGGVWREGCVEPVPAFNQAVDDERMSP